MAVQLKTFTATSLAEALTLVQRDLGSKAVVLHTRKYRQGGIFGLGGTTIVEVTAAAEAPARPRRPDSAPAPSAPAAAPPKAARQALNAYAAVSGAATEPKTASSSGSWPGIDVAPAPRQMPTTSAPAPTQESAGDLIRRSYQAAKAELERNHAQQAPAWTGADTRAPAPTELIEEMRAVRRLVTQVVNDQKNPPVRNDLPEQLQNQYLALLEQEMTRELADEVVQRVRSGLSEIELRDPGKVRRVVQKCLGEFIPVDPQAGALQPTPDGRPRVIALIGPTGVGKTTTIAKLAANFKLKHKKKVGLITIDTYRIAAVEQLRTYANILGVPLHVVTSPQDMADALRKCAGCDVVLIDTAGRSQRDDPRLDQLRGFLQAADPHEVHLVLSSTCHQAVLLETIERFSAIRADRIIFTKLDEAVTFGVLFNVARKVNKRLSFVTTGQEVPHQIEPGRGDRLANLVLGGGV